VAQDKDKEKENEKESAAVVKTDKDKEKEKRLNERNAKKAAAAKKPKKSILKYFKDARAEFKKVTWPTPKQIVNNTAVVLAMLVVAGLAIWGLDTLFVQVFAIILKSV